MRYAYLVSCYSWSVWTRDRQFGHVTMMERLGLVLGKDVCYMSGRG